MEIHRQKFGNPLHVLIVLKVRYRPEKTDGRRDQCEGRPRDDEEEDRKMLLNV